MQILHDLFPAIVAIMPASDPTPITELASMPNTKGSRQINTARVVITDTRAQIYTDAPTGPLKVFDEAYTLGNFSKAPANKGDSQIILDSGAKMVYQKDGACGCGSRLRSMSVTRMLSSSADPTA